MSEPYRMRKSPAKLALPLLQWYDQVHQNRDMPWRQTRDPYAIWLSETMLQQTQVETVKPYYARFLERFPTLPALAAAPLEDVLTLWAGLGYYRRARHLHAAAREVMARHAGSLPSNVDSLMDLPGIGRYTAGAVGSIAFGLSAPVVDGNVMRVLARLAAYDKDIALPKNAEFFWTLAAEILRGAASSDAAPRYGDVNQSLMELGATVCTPANPRCDKCPARSFCRAYKEGRQAELPVKGKKKAVPEVRGVALVIVRSAAKTGKRGQQSKRGVGTGAGEVLLMMRPQGGLWEEMWEFPVLASPAVTAETIRKSIGLNVKDIRNCGDVQHQLTHRLMQYTVIMCSAVTRDEGVLPGDYVAARWVPWPFQDLMLPMARVVGKMAALALVTAS
jgi:A/G-specific adenine glycosylase